MDSDSGTEDGHRPTKKTRTTSARGTSRVTKACDQCRKRRVRCELYPNAGTEKPCRVCTEAGQALSCTFSRPTKKRGPPPGLAKSLEDRVATFERLVGHLISHTPQLRDAAATFLSTDPQTTNATKQVFDASGLAQLVENYASALSSVNTGLKEEKGKQTTTATTATPPPPPPSFTSASATTSQQAQHGLQQSPAGATASSSYSLTPSLPPPPSGASSSAHVVTSTSWPTQSGSKGLSQPGLPTSDRATGFHAANDAREGLSGPSAAPPPSKTAPSVTLPSDHIRLQVLDLYFNQVVNPSMPFLNKNVFFRWSAHLPPGSVNASDALTDDVSLELCLALFAVTVPYLPPVIAADVDAATDFAAAGRWHLHLAMQAPTLQTVQAACLLAVADWAQGELHRAWTLSALSLALALSLSLHRRSESQPGAKADARLTFDAVLNVHALSSLRATLPLLAPSSDAFNTSSEPEPAEDFELWRSDKSPAALRAERGLQHEQSPVGDAVRTVRSSSFSTFARFTSLCALANSIRRWEDEQHEDRESDRQNLLAALVSWQQSLPNHLAVGPTAGQVDYISNRSRHIVDMHITFFVLWIRLTKTSPKPDDQQSLTVVVDALSHCMSAYRQQFTLLRSLPWIELALHDLSDAARSNQAVSNVVRTSYSELSHVQSGAKEPWRLLSSQQPYSQSPQTHATLDMTLDPSSSTVPPAPTAAPALTKPFEALLSFSNELGHGASPATVVDYSMWDQADLLVSLGLIADPNAAATNSAWSTLNGAFAKETGVEPVPPLPVVNETGLSGVGQAQLADSLASQLPEPADAVASMSSWPEVQQPMDLMDRWLARGALGFDV
ncbi:hypothetical protein ACM66B_006411 [Microbotryomycetes sp. NB124-2]